MSTTSTGTSTGRPSGRHRLEVGHLVMGLAFVGLVAAWALAQGGVVSGTDLRWLLPLPWLLAGAAGLTAIAVTSLRGRGPATDTTSDPPTDDTTPDTLTEIMEEQR